ncbi:endonuclease VII domain-containing protein [Actinoplanes bogorensis]|uniref:Endonuclease VII domain-containing protein n=1 Tax=Paractinoplanes bogorensis TaxID=1610840 RepID=A0ABS5YPV4_9ACTN|nr:endonuclease VII domain-containing protein [Actinoplanes bogorensis]MBU2665492.1 endonuclease VII domain-containing protein [Actinoplanes bogorensis]
MDVPCPRCHKLRPPESFVTATGQQRKSCRSCLEAKREVNRRHRLRIGPDGVRAANLRDKYGISVEEYDALRASQDYRCAVCRQHENEIPATNTGRPRLDGRPPAVSFKLVVDHCHRTGRVRGLLCAGCNSLIGHARDSPAILTAAAAYLQLDPGTVAPSLPALSRLRVVDAAAPEGSFRTFQFRGSVTVRIGDHEIHLPEGATRTVVASATDIPVVAS